MREGKGEGLHKIEKNRLKEIKRLHTEILNSLKMSLEKAIRIGAILTEQKENLKHGEFTTWVTENLPFTDRTARNYMRVYRERDRLKTETVSDLKAAYTLLIEHKPELDNIPQLSKIEMATALIEGVRTEFESGKEFTLDELSEIHHLAMKIEGHGLEIKLVSAWNLGRIEEDRTKGGGEYFNP